MQKIKFSLLGLTLGTLLAACSGTSNDQPNTDKGNVSPPTETAPAIPARTIQGTVKEYVMTADSGTYTATPRVWSAGAHPVYAKAMKKAGAGAEAADTETIATGSISESGALNITLPSTVPDTALIDVNDTENLWKDFGPSELYKGLTCTNTVVADNSDAETKLATTLLEYSAPEDASILLLESRLPNISIVQQGNLVRSTQQTSWALFIYTTKDITMTGTQSCSGTQNTQAYEVEVEYDSAVDISLQRGWNQVHYEFDSVNVYDTESGKATRKNKLRATNGNSKQWFVSTNNNVAIPLELTTAVSPTLR